MKHTITIAKPTGTKKHQATCSCGWTSARQHTAPAAERIGKAHLANDHREGN